MVGPNEFVTNDPPTLARLNALLAAGYRIDHATSQKVVDAVWLDHPADSRAQWPTLILYTNGIVVSESSRDPSNQLRLLPDQTVEFARFLAMVPTATIWERTADLRIQAIVVALFIAIMAVMWIVIGFVGDMVANVIGLLRPDVWSWLSF